MTHFLEMYTCMCACKYKQHTYIYIMKTKTFILDVIKHD